MNKEERIQFLPFLLVLIRRRVFIALNFILVCAVAFYFVVFVMDTQYVSSVTFLPPWQPQGMQTLFSSINLGFGGGSDVMPEQIQTILESKALRLKVIDKFDLYKKYKLTKQANKIEMALKKLEDDLVVTTTEKGNMGITQFVSLTLQAYHTSPDTAFLMVNYAFKLMDSTVNAVGTERGKRDREFIEKQLNIATDRLKTLQSEFREFQLKHKAFNIPEQLKLSLKTYSKVRATMVTNEIRIKRLLLDYSPNYPEIVELRKTNRALKSKLSTIENGQKDDVLVGLELSTKLTPIFTNYIRDIEVQNKVLLLLTQEYEQSKMKESRNVSSIKIVDPSFVPEYKVRPKRASLIAGIVLVYMLFIFFVIFFQHFFVTQVNNTKSYKQIIDAFRSK